MEYLPIESAAKLETDEKFFINVRKEVIPALIKSGKLQGKKVKGKDCVLIDDAFHQVMRFGIERFALNRQGFCFTAFQAPIEKVAAALRGRKDVVLGYTESVRPVKPKKNSAVTMLPDRRDCFLIQSPGTEWCVLVQTVHWSELSDMMVSERLAMALSAGLKTQTVAVWDDDTSGSGLMLCDKGKKKKVLTTEEDDTPVFYGFFYQQGIGLDRCFITSDGKAAQLEVDEPEAMERVDYVVLAVSSEAAGVSEMEEDEDDAVGERDLAERGESAKPAKQKPKATLKQPAPSAKKKGLTKAEMKALFRQVEKGDTKAVKAWLKETDEVDVRGECDWTPFLWAVRYQQTKLAELLLDAGADLNTKTSKTGYEYAYLGVNALMIAIHHKDEKSQEMLMKRGIDLKATDSAGWNALLMALIQRNSSLAKKLIDFGLRVPETEYERALRFLVSGSYNELAEIVVKVHPGIESCSSVLVKSAWHGNLELVKFLLTVGFDVNAIYEIEGGTALKAAACKGHDAVVKFLLANGADPNKMMKGGETPLAWAKRCKKYKVITILKKVTK